MGKICWINGQPYSVSIPTGGGDGSDRDSQWGHLIDFFGEDHDNLFHWDRQYSWCQEKVYISLGAVRGCRSLVEWDSFPIDSFGPGLGFRPVFTPLDTNTLEPDRSLLVDIPDGQKIALSSLYIDENPVDLSEEKGPNYNKGEEIILGDRDKSKNNWLYVVKYKDLLWADRNVLVNISWEDLRKQGYTD